MLRGRLGRRWIFMASAVSLCSGQSMPPLPDLPGVDALPSVTDLPDPFTFRNGSKVVTAEDWRKRREEIKETLLHYQYGFMPPPPGNVKAREISSQPVFAGKGIQKVIELTMGPGDRIKFQLGMTIPAGKGPFPLILKNDRGINMSPAQEEGVSRGYIIADYNRHQLDQDNADRSDGVHPVYPTWNWATLSAWAWGSHRAVDYLLTLDYVDKARIAVTGQSRGGKTALLAAALDERIALAAPNGSGAGGCGQYRFVAPEFRGSGGQSIETLDAITRNFGYWFVPSFRTFANKEEKVPFDQHFLKALVAPRPLLCNDALEDYWANPRGNSQTTQAAQEVYAFLGVPDRIGIHFRPGGHSQSAGDWSSIMDFCDVHFFGKTNGTNFQNNWFPGLARTYDWKRPVPTAVRPRARGMYMGPGAGKPLGAVRDGKAFALSGKRIFR